MEDLVRVSIHASQFPDRVRRELLESLRTRRVNHKFHYESLKQTQRWLALHEAYSPARTDQECALIYDRSFEAVSKRLGEADVQVVGLGCGGGQKDVRLLKCLREAGARVSYIPTDVGVPMVLVAQQAAATVLSSELCSPLVCDLSTAEDLPAVLEKFRNLRKPGKFPQNSGAIRVHPTTRIFTFFGMLPNFEPEQILPRLGALVRPGDELLVSANLAPGRDYVAGMKRILPLYDNALTRDWLMTFLSDLGIEPHHGALRFGVEDGPGESGLKRIAADFNFESSCSVAIDGQRFDFRSGDTIRVFFSYRHTPALVESLLSAYGLRVQDRWVTPSGEEGVFLVHPSIKSASG